jgi:transposase
MMTDFDKKRYFQRNKVETVFSVMKRQFGDEISARLFRSQVKEVKIKCIVYSIDRFLKIQRIFMVD